MTDSALDGVIKYRSQRVAGVFAVPAKWAQLNAARTALFDLGLIGITAQGVGYGNLSLRTQGDQFLITGSATGAIRQLDVNQYCLVESFSVPQNTVVCRGALDPSSESMTHGSIYQAKAQVRCVVHGHSRGLFDDLLRSRALHTPAEVPYGTPAMAQAVTRLVAGQTALPVIFVMAGHDEGVVAYGADIASATQLMVETFQKIHSHDQDRHHRR
ncbi:MAG: class II aldolase/adducin family protein [Rhodoferax sp.]|nr:class II aldolase/adducin family protein [Rhodoferax sp.]